MNVCYLSLGSNQNSPERQIRKALQSIRSWQSTSITKISSLYWTKAWGLEVQQDFCNAMVEVITVLPPILLLDQCKKIENQHGRNRKKPWGPSTLDIDIILYAKRYINTKDLSVPHPHMLSRDFVLIPLLEINPSIALHYSNAKNTT